MANTRGSPSSMRNTATCRPFSSAQTPVLGTMSSSAQTALQWSVCRSRCMVCSCLNSADGDGDDAFAFIECGRPDLAALLHEQHIAVSLVAVDEVAEALARLGIFNGRFPLADVGVDHVLHLRFQFGGDVQLVGDDHLLQVFQTAFEVVAPDAGALQAVRGAGVEHQEAVDVAHQRLLVEVRRQQLGVARLHAAVAADVEVPALFGGNDADVLALRLGAFAGAAGDAELDLVRRAQTLVAVFQFDREAETIGDAEAAPRRTDAGLHRAQRFAVGVAGFETGSDQFFPYQRQLLDARAKQINALAAGDLGVQAVLLGDHADGDQAIGRDFAAGHARHHRVGAVLLYIAEEVVVGVLQAGVSSFQHEVVPARGQDAGGDRLADFAAEALPMLRQQRAEAFDFADADQVVQLLARIGEVLADVVVDGHAELFHFRLHDLRDQRHAAAAPGASLGAAFQRADGGGAAGHGLAQRAFRDVVARADLRAGRQRVDAERGPRLAVRLRQDQELRRFGQLDPVQHHLQQRTVFAGVADHHAAEQIFAAVGDDDFFVDLFALVGELVAAAARDLAVRVADAGDVDAHQF